MTFFSQQKKKLNEKIISYEGAGPGAYTPTQMTSHSQSYHSYAPFGSLQKKQLIVKDVNKQPLGPGTYNINRDIIKPSIIKYQNQNCIIIKINQQGNHQFKSKIERFSNTIGSNTPGPGSYQSKPSIKRSQRKRTNSVGSTFHKMKQLYSNQYKSRRIPTLASDKPQTSNENIKKRQNFKGFVRWDLNKKQRFKTQQKQEFNQQDKSILLDRLSFQQRKHKLRKKQSSFFASKSVKSCFDQLIYKSSNPFKVQIRKMLGFQDETPGPGSYDPALAKQQKRPNKFQFFGSTVDRFSKQECQKVGPGDYQVQPSKQQKSSVRKLTKAKRVARKAITQPDEQNIRGPGYYNILNQTVIKPTFNSKYKSGVAQFGSNIPRFEKPAPIKQQGKSQYISFMAQQDEERKKRIQEQYQLRRKALKNKKHSVFLSQTKRGCFPQTQTLKEIPFASYQVGIGDIGTKLKKKKQLIQQFASCNLTKPGFESNVERFKTQKQQTQTHKDCWCQIKQVQKKNIQHMSPAFQSNSLRTEVFEIKNKGPSVGQYSKQSTFIKQSFNSRFIKQNKNKTKKIKIWKTQK